MKLAVFDFDSTLMDGETIEFLGKAYGVENQIQKITQEAMEGKLDFYESLRHRVGLLKGMNKKEALEICQNLPLNKGAKEVVEELQSIDYKVICFSGGFKFATEFFSKILNLDGEFSNILHSKNDILTGDVGGEMMFSDSKGKMLKTLQRLLNVSYENTLVIGDGANDLSMFKYANKKVAFCAKEVLKKEANIIIDTKDLREVLNFI